jgi:isopenicillin N synthase-like dioxygenase
MSDPAASDFRRIPVIDVSALAGSDAAAVERVAAEIRRASIEVGFFYVSGHNVPRDLVRATLLAAKYFFQLPDATKQAILVNSAHRGYVPFAQTTQPGRKRPDLKESFNFAYPFTRQDLDELAGRALIGNNQWPAGEPVWRAVIEDYYREVFDLGQRILEAFAVAFACPAIFSEAGIVDRWYARACSTIRRRRRASTTDSLVRPSTRTTARSPFSGRTTSAACR